MKLWVGPTQPRPEVSMKQVGATAAIGSFRFATRLLPLPLLRTVPYFGNKRKRKASGTHCSYAGLAACWRGRPASGSGQPRACARALQRFRSNRLPEAGGGRAQAHARDGPAPRAATSGALVEVRFRVAALLAGRPWGLVTRAGAHERPRRRGSAGCPESGRWAGVGAGDGSRPLFPSVASVCPQSGADWVAQDPRRGGGGVGSARVPDRARVGAEAGSSAWESGTWGPRTAPRHLRDLRQVTLPFWVSVSLLSSGRDIGFLLALTVHLRAGLGGAWVSGIQTAVAGVWPPEHLAAVFQLCRPFNQRFSECESRLWGSGQVNSVWLSESTEINTGPGKTLISLKLLCSRLPRRNEFTRLLQWEILFFVPLSETLRQITNAKTRVREYVDHWGLW